MNYVSKTALVFILFFVANIWTANGAPSLKHVHPLNWWAGMEYSEIQVMLHGDNIGDCEVSLAGAQDVTLTRVERVANPNYLFVYLDLKNAAPQRFEFQLRKQGKKKVFLSQPYEIQERTGKMPEPFTAADVMYLLMPDRWIDGDPILNNVPSVLESKVNLNADGDFGRHGGDLKGIEMGLGYLQDLGVTAIWPTPVQINDMERDSYHGYAITDYYRIDPRLGSNEQYRDLISKCHDHGIKMVMDLVFNHCGRNNFLFQDLPQEDWFNFKSNFEQSVYRTGSVGDVHASEYDRLRTTDGWFVYSMPDFNQKNPLVRDYLIQASIWWVEYATVDGIRQDTYPYADREMMAAWCKALDREYPGYNVVGETWVNNNVGVAYWQKDSRLSDSNSELPSVMDFPLFGLLNRVVDEESDSWDNGLARIYEYISADRVYANQDNLLTFLANHDTNRFAPDAEKAANHDRYKQALTLLLTLRGIPQLYYGDEIGMYANKGVTDGQLRQNFPVEALTKQGRTAEQEALHAFTRNLLQWRKGNKAAQFGKLVHFAVRQGCYVYSRTMDGERITVIMNGTSAEQELDLACYAEVLPKAAAKDIISGKNIVLGEKLTLKPRQQVVLEF